MKTGAVLAMLCACTVSQAKTSVHNLQVEYMTQPLGLDTAKPRFSWSLDDPANTRGQHQTAYRVLVATSPALLAQRRTDLWDSGKRASDASLNVQYAGKPLKPGQVCYWTVQVWDALQKPTGYADTRVFSIGLLKPEDWKAEWIGMGSADDSACPWFRKRFHLDKVPAQALAYVGTIGFQELYVNGVKADSRVIAPSVSNLRKRALYVTYDIRKLLKAGDNVIGIWTAPGWAHFSDANPVVDFGVAKAPLVKAQFQFGAASGIGKSLATDTTWRCSLSSTRHLGECHNSNYGGDHVDGAVSPTAWATIHADDSEWSPATIYYPSLLLTPDLAPATRAYRQIAAQAIQPAGEGRYRVEMAHLYTGWIKVKLSGKPGDKVVIKCSTLKEKECEYNQLNEYVIGPTGEGQFCNRFSYHEIQYVMIEGLRKAPQLDDVVGWTVGNFDKPRATFECNNPLLNRIHQVTVDTYVGLSTGGMTVDCPHRERLGYGGDGHTSLELSVDHFDADAFFRKWAQDWCDIQQPDGRINHTAPTMGGGGGPGWSGFVIVMPWEVYQTSGDTRILERCYPTMRRLLDYFGAHCDQYGLFQPLPGGFWLFLGDWVTPHGDEGSDSQDALLFNNCYYLYTTRLAAKIATVLGRPQDAREYEQRAHRLVEAINQKFWRANEKTYLNNRQGHTVMPLISGAVPATEREAVLRSLQEEILVARNGHLDTGLHGTYFMTKLLTELQRSDLVYTYATQTTHPSYGDMLKKGYETWPECWGGAESKMHGCLNGIGGWFLRGLAGIRPDASAPGYKHFIVRPALVGDITSVKATRPTPYGDIHVDWKRTNSAFTITVQAPANSRARVYLPTKQANDITESGSPLSECAGAKLLGVEDGNVVVEIGAGRYDFHVNTIKH